MDLTGFRDKCNVHVSMEVCLSTITIAMVLMCMRIQEVIGGLVDGAIPLDDEGVGVIKDTLAILASKEIKLTTLRR